MLSNSRITKPKYPDAVVDRPRLYRRLSRWQEGRGIAIHAPAGYGKSSLVSRWIDVSNLGDRAAWLSLEESEADPHQFVYQVACALNKVCPGVQEAVEPILEDTQSSAERVLERLLTALEHRLMSPEWSSQDLLLVLDDLHQVQSPEIDAMLRKVLELGPENLHLLLLARWRTELPLARLVAHEQVVALTKEDLRFTEGEVGEYIQRQGFPPPSASELAQLAQRSEGWVTALKLSVLSSRRRDSVSELITALQGDREWLAEFLTDEVLKQQSPELRHFLLQTSILGEFNAELCGAVSGATDSYAMLAAIARVDLFLLQLGSGGGWFRYHHLFQELLQHRLRAQTDDAEVAELHRRAAAWLADAGHTSAAVRHLFAAGDIEEAATLIESDLREIVLVDPYKAHALLDLLPDAVVLQRPRLMLDRLRLALVTVNVLFGRYLQEMEAAFKELLRSCAKSPEYRTEFRVYRAARCYLLHDFEAAAGAVDKVRSDTGLMDDFTRGTLNFLQMRLEDVERPSEAAVQYAEQALAAYRRAGFVAGTVAVRRELARRAMHSGHARIATDRFQTLLDGHTIEGPMVVRELAFAHFCAAENRYWQNDLERAREHQGSLLALAELLQDDQLIYFANAAAQTYAASEMSRNATTT